MKFRLTEPWPLGNLTAPADTVLDFGKPDKWTDAAHKGRASRSPVSAWMTKLGRRKYARIPTIAICWEEVGSDFPRI